MQIYVVKPFEKSVDNGLKRKAIHELATFFQILDSVHCRVTHSLHV